jgi:hypothetical protein
MLLVFLPGSCSPTDRQLAVKIYLRLDDEAPHLAKILTCGSIPARGYKNWFTSALELRVTGSSLL